MKNACGKAHMKSILAVGELGSLENIYKASFIAMMAGSDFIKTSTGKEAVNATFVNALVMIRAIRDYYLITGFKVKKSFFSSISISLWVIYFLLILWIISDLFLKISSHFKNMISFYIILQYHKII